MTDRHVTVVCILGQGRTGSTLLAQLLDQHTRMHAIGEVFPFRSKFVESNNLCSCGSPVNKCSFWKTILSSPDIQARLSDLTKTENHHLMRLRHFRSLLSRLDEGAAPSIIEAGASALRLFTQKIRHKASGSILVDSTKTPNVALLYRMAGLQVKIIHLIRDSRAIMYSWRGHRGRKSFSGYRNTLKKISPLGLLRSCAEYYPYQSYSELMGRFVGNYTRVRYEDLAQEPATCLKRLFKSCKLSDQSERIVTNKTANVQNAHIIGGNPSRFNHGTVNIRFDDEWKRKLPALERLITTFLTYPLLHRYGYDT